MAGNGSLSAIDLEQHLAFELTRVVEEAAVAAARTMGQGDRKGSDQAAVQAMRRAFEDRSHRGQYRHR
jgi:fructose-1,6-bisphosphatase II